MRAHYFQYEQCFSALNYVPILLLLLLTASGSTALAARRLADRNPEKAQDKITALPGQPPNITFNQYSGYITVDNAAGRALFYWLIEAPAEANPSSKPLILWLNGGPGCSSVGFGGWDEIGPFRVQIDGTLKVSNFSWNTEANLLFLDSPAGVGFSYSNTSSDISAGDVRTANDSYTFLTKWFQRFPEYNHRPFYLSGESYAGHYVPQLSQLIYRNNKGNQNPLINFKGFLLGNPLLDNTNDNIGKFEYWWNHGLIGDTTYQVLNKSCPGDSVLFPKNQVCNETLIKAQTWFGAINPYSIYEFLVPCDNITKLEAANLKTPMPWRLQNNDQCSSTYAKIYLNTPEVQKAFHANVTGVNYPWVACSGPVRLNYTDSPDTVLPILKELIAGGLKLWVFSGDTDAVMPVSSTRYSIRSMQLKPIGDFHAWYDGKEVAGWSQIYEGLRYLTVRGAGHEVPNGRPNLGLALLRSFLYNQTAQANATRS